MNLQEASNQIKEKGWFYTVLKQWQKDAAMGDGDGIYEGSCPCFGYENESFSLDCVCWRGAGKFKYSGLEVKDKTGKVSLEELKQFAVLVLGDITQIWANTDWEYSLNEEEPVKYKDAVELGYNEAIKEAGEILGERILN